MSMQAMYIAVTEWLDRLDDRMERVLDANGFSRMALCPASAFAVPATGALTPDRWHSSIQFAAEQKPEASGAQSEGSSPKNGSLKDKVNSILSVADEDEEDAELLEELSKPKKKFFGLFG